MKLDVYSKALGRIVFSILDRDIEIGGKNVANSAMLYGIDPADLEVSVAADPAVSDHLERFGEEWYVDSDEVKAVAPRKMSA
jgi:hypothetical protein|nr:hypothetical protein [Neorhizobium tomejilense]